jgi:NodT family efflux transporter outer membrane factor (OMF) lipoprotein
VRVELSENAPNLAIADRAFWDYQLGFDAAWELDFWGRFRRGIEAAGAGYLATVAGYDEALVTVTAELARAYVLLRTFQERLAVARRNVDVQRETLRMADIRFRNGLVPELDVTQARALLRDTEALLPLLETGVLESRHAISTLLGRPPDDLNDLLGTRALDAVASAITPGKTIIPSPPPDIAVGAPVDLLRRRPDVRRAELEAAAQSARIGLAKADLYPRFALIGSIGLASSDNGGLLSGNAELGDLFDSASITYKVGPVFSWPILNYGRLRNSVRIQDARFQQLVIAYKNTVLDAAREVEDALAAYLLSQVRSRHLGDSVESAKRSVELALAQYRAGLVTYQRVLDTQLFLVRQEDRLAETRGSVALNLIATYKALGGGWEIRQGRRALPPEIEEEMRSRTHWGRLLSSAPEGESEGHKP